MSKLPAQGLREVSENFHWGQVLDAFRFDMDDKTCTILKYHPWVNEKGNIRIGRPDTTQVMFHNNETRNSDGSIQASLIRWIAHTNLGLNQHALVAGICRALDVKDAS
jgi:hypothetical protein